MKIRFLSIGKTASPFLKEGIAFYLSRLEHYARIEYEELPDVSARGTDNQAGKQKEGELVLKNVKDDEILVLLDEKGDSYSSREFAEFLQKRMNSGIKTLTFLVGGAFGFSKEIYDRANAKLSFSKMTFSHEMIRLFALEQLYRAHTLLKGENYHHD